MQIYHLCSIVWGLKISMRTFRYIGNDDANQEDCRIQPRIPHGYRDNKEKYSKEDGYPRDDRDKVVHFFGNGSLRILETGRQTSNSTHESSIPRRNDHPSPSTFDCGSREESKVFCFHWVFMSAQHWSVVSKIYSHQCSMENLSMYKVLASGVVQILQLKKNCQLLVPGSQLYEYLQGFYFQTRHLQYLQPPNPLHRHSSIPHFARLGPFEAPTYW